MRASYTSVYARAYVCVCIVRVYTLTDSSALRKPTLFVAGMPTGFLQSSAPKAAPRTQLPTAAPIRCDIQTLPTRPPARPPTQPRTPPPAPFPRCGFPVANTIGLTFRRLLYRLQRPTDSAMKGQSKCMIKPGPANANFKKEFRESQSRETTRRDALDAELLREGSGLHVGFEALRRKLHDNIKAVTLAKSSERTLKLHLREVDERLRIALRCALGIKGAKLGDATGIDATSCKGCQSANSKSKSKVHAYICKAKNRDGRQGTANSLLF